MSESTSRAQFSVSGSPAPLFYVWQVTGKPLAAGICVDLIEPLDRQAVETFRSMDSRGTEIGGLLWGSLTPGEPAVAYVEEFETIACDYGRGPLYRLAEADLARMDAAIERRKGSGVEVVGFFRSHTRRGLGLDSDDMALLESRFHDPRQFALLIRPFASKASTAGIFIWESGKMRTEASYLEFPFQAAQLTTSSSAGKNGAAISAANPKQAPRAKVISMMSRLDIAPPEPPARPAAPTAPATPAAAPAPPPAAEPPKAAAPAPPPAPAPAKPAETAAPEPRKPEAQADYKFKKGKQKPGSRPPSVTPEPPAAPEPAVQAPPAAESPSAPAFAAPSGFEDAPEPRRGKMMWIWGAVAAIVLACSGALFVYPGLLRKQVRPMTPLTLHIERTASDILLSWNRDSDAIKNAKRAVLSIYDGDRQENFEMDLAQLHNGSIVYAPLTADVSFKMELTGADQSKIASEMVRVLRTRPSPMGDTGAQTATSGAPAAAAAGKPAEAAKTAATTEPEQPAEAQQEEAATVRTAPVRAFNADSLSQRLRPALPTEAPAAPSLSASAPVASMNLGVIVPSQIAAPARPSAAGSTATPATRSSQVVPAQVITRRDPIYPQLAKQTGASGQVRVSVTIGPDGKVKSVKAISGHILLQRAATDAVKQWVYRPTMLNGVAVESQSEVVLTFNAQR